MDEKIDALITYLAFVENRELKKIILNNFVKKYGEIPEEYREAVDAVMEVQDE